MYTHWACERNAICRGYVKRVWSLDHWRIHLTRASIGCYSRRHALLVAFQDSAMALLEKVECLAWVRYFRFPQQITCWISAFFTCCFEGVAPVYLQKLCCSTLGVHRRDSLCFSRQGELLVLQLQTFIMQCPVFSVAGPAIEIERPVALWVMPRAHIRF